MHVRTWQAAALLLLATLVALSTAFASSSREPRADDVRALDGVWIYVEDRTEGRALEDQQSSMGGKVTLRVEEAAVVLVRSDGEIRMALDGSATEVSREGSTSRYSGTWKDGAFRYQSEPVTEPGSPTRTGIRWELRPTADGLLAGVETDSGWKSIALYRHPEDIPLPTPAKATIGDLTWLAGAWVGTRGTGGTTSMEERWCPPLGGAMLAVSRTVSRQKMTAFEYLRIVERDGGLVYVAQPGGRSPTEFVLTELAANRAVFENPRHDSPQRIVYELSAEGGLSASIGSTKGGRPKRFDFQREVK
ncbi:MAG: hypothetical protein IT453_01675 [Planctomycetes bacterium]|nr:hypothetical protein [Planctomycetota bacterium]